jgi:hypothetical protein
LYLDFETSKKVQYLKNQVLDVPLVAKSWIKPRFINQTNLSGDTFMYVYGAGGVAWDHPVGGYLDTTMSWYHTTWGGSVFGQSKHYIAASLIRNGIERDTKIYYFVPPGDTSVITIRY